MDVACRSCGSNTYEFLDLGHHPPSDAFLSREDLNKPETYYPLNVRFCEKCKLVQLGYIVDKKILFNDEYPYITGGNSGGVKHFRSLANDVIDRFGIKCGDLVVDIGSNDGTLLKGFREKGISVCGFEPCDNLAKIAAENGITTISNWFCRGILREKSVKVITACNVFAHIEDINDVLLTVCEYLSDDGVFIIESPYLPDMVKNLEYDTIYHEHIYYWMYTSLQKVLGKHDLEIFDVEKQDIHGGTMRYYISRRGAHDRVRHRVKSTFESEKDIDIQILHDFSSRVIVHKVELVDLIERIRRKGKRVFGIGAPAKGNTLINYCKLKLDYITEINPMKIGKYTPSAHIPIVEEGNNETGYGLILSWNWKDEIINNNTQFLANGGRFIIPIPEPKIEHIGSGVWAGYEL